jgi:hypothetical protein
MRSGTDVNLMGSVPIDDVVTAFGRVLRGPSLRHLRVL